MNDTLDTRELLRVLGEIPLAYVRLDVAVTAPRRKGGGGAKVSGGTRDFTPINVEAEAQRDELRDAVRAAHQVVAETFGEHYGFPGIQPACEDLTRWSDIWTLAPFAMELSDNLSEQLRRANKITGHSEEPTKLPQTVCPRCFAMGGMTLDDGNGEEETYGCTGCGARMTSGEYVAAVKEALTRFSPAA